MSRIFGSMSVRTTNRATAAQLMTVPKNSSDPNNGLPMGAMMDEMSLAEGSGMRTTQPNEPMIRTLNVSVRGNLSDLTSNPALSSWVPTQEALSTIFQQTKFKNLQGEVAQRGDLKSVILHSISVKAVQSDFPFGKRPTCTANFLCMSNNDSSWAPRRLSPCSLRTHDTLFLIS